ncbi:hypothetical protein QOT17_022452, partial [Balamuthia mandrillaris]
LVVPIILQEELLTFYHDKPLSVYMASSTHLSTCKTSAGGHPCGKTINTGSKAVCYISTESGLPKHFKPPCSLSR